jgi:ABC-type sugar transport system permease subunit
MITNSSTLKKLYKSRIAYLFLSPLIIGLLLFSYYPAFSGLYHSMFNWDSIGHKEFIGIANFAELFRDDVFIDSLSVMLKLMIPRLAISIIIPFIIAEMIFFISSKKAQYWYRILVLLPMVAPGVVYTLIWKYIYDPNNGLLTALLRALNVFNDEMVINWLGDPKTVIIAIIFLGFPWIGGTSVLIYMSGMMNISTELIECSRLDGASTIRRIISIDIPMLMGQFRYFLIFGIIGGFQDYSVQVILTKGGPGYSTMVPGYYMFTQAFDSGRMGYASAIGTVLFFAILVLTILSFKFAGNKT